MNEYKTAIKKYAAFKGRASRKEYWGFTWFNALIICGLLVIQSFFLKDLIPILLILYGLLVYLPTLALTIRRLHDIGKSGWLYLGWVVITLLLSFYLSDIFPHNNVFLYLLIAGITVMFIAWWYLMLIFKNGQPGENQYGPNPKGVEIL